MALVCRIPKAPFQPWWQRQSVLQIVPLLAAQVCDIASCAMHKEQCNLSMAAHDLSIDRLRSHWRPVES